MGKKRGKSYWLAFPHSKGWHRVKAGSLQGAKQKFRKGTTYKDNEIRQRRSAPPNSKGKNYVKTG